MPRMNETDNIQNFEQMNTAGCPSLSGYQLNNLTEKIQTREKKSEGIISFLM